MCKECRKLLELFVETQLECLKKNKSITKLIVGKCKCGEYIFIVAETTDNNTIIIGPNKADMVEYKDIDRLFSFNILQKAKQLEKMQELEGEDE